MDVKEPIRLLEVFFSNVLTLSIFIQGCLIISCLNDGSCLPDNEKQTFSCSCQQPWTGDRCEVKKGKFKTYLLYIQCADAKPTQTMVKTDSSLAQWTSPTSHKSTSKR